MMFLKIYILLFAFVVGAVHSIHDPAYTGIKTKTHQRDPQIAQALHQQQQQQRFTANQYQHKVDYQHPLNDINNDESERLSSAAYNHNEPHQHHHHQPQQQQLQPPPINSYHQELPMYERKFHERHAAAASTPMSSSNWDDAENVITEYYTGCPAQFTGQLPYVYDCRRFLNCWNGRGHIQSCAPGTVFNPDTLECDRPDKVVCGAVGSLPPQRRRQSSENYQAGRLLDAKVEHVPTLCPPGVTGLHPHPTDCTKFLNCANGNVHVQDCGPGTAYSIPMMVCDFNHKVDCSGRTGGPIANTDYENRRTAYDTNTLDVANEVNGIFCPAGVSGHFTYPFDYSKFMNCQNGNTAIQNCVHGTMFSISKGFCESQNEIDVTDHVDSTIIDKNYEYFQTVMKCPPGMYGAHLYPYDCTKYLNCMPNQEISLQNCAPGMVYSHLRKECLPQQHVLSKDRVQYAHVDPKDTGSNGGTQPVGNAIVVNCPASGLGLYPYPFDCSKYLRCENGQIIVEVCAAGSVFSLPKKRCDLKERVDASERVTYSTDYDDREMDSTIKGDFQSPFNAAPESLVCIPGLDGLFLHPFDCTAYFRCLHGVRTIEYCTPGTVFSITRQQCVLKNQVSVFDRVDFLLDTHQTHPPSTPKDYGQTLNWPHDSTADRSEFSQNDIRQPDNVICPPNASGFYPHPFDCQKYLNCANGRTEVKTCGFDRAWDTAMEVCIANHQVDCSDRHPTRGDGTSGDFTLIPDGLRVSQAMLPPYYDEAISCMSGLTGLFAHPFDCTKYLNCRNGRTIIQNCIAGNVFSLSKKYCELKEQVEPSDRVPFVHEYGHELMDETEGDGYTQRVLNPSQITCPAGAGGLHLYPFDFRKYLKCEGDRTVTYSCPAGMQFNLTRKECVAQSTTDHTGFLRNAERHPEWEANREYSSPKANNSPYVECPHGATGMHPHPFDCTKFLNCANGVTHIQDCGPGTAWNNAMEVCDFKANVDCSGPNEDYSNRGPKKIEPVGSTTNWGPSNPNYHPARPFTAQTTPTHPHQTPQHYGSGYDRPTYNIDSSRGTPSTTTVYGQQPEHRDRWTSMHRPRPDVDSRQRPLNNEWDADMLSHTRPSDNTPSTWSGTFPTVHQPPPQTAESSQQPNRNYAHTARQYPTPLAPFSPSVTTPSTTSNTPITNTNIYYAQPVDTQEDSRGTFPSVHHPPTQAAESSQQPNRNYAHTARQYPTPLAPFSPSVTTPSTTSTTPITNTNIYYAQPVGSQEDSRETFDNISGGDLGPVKQNSSIYSYPSRSNKWTPIAQFPNYNQPPFPSLPMPPHSSTPHLNAQHPIEQHHGSIGTDTVNVPLTRLMPPHTTDSRQHPQNEPSNFNVTTIILDNLPGRPWPTDASNLYGEMQPPATASGQAKSNPDGARPLYISPSVSVHSPSVNDATNLYGGLQPPNHTPTQPSTTPRAFLSQPTYPTFPSRPYDPEHDKSETQARVYQIYPPIANATFQAFPRDPHYSPPYAGVAHSRNTSWPSYSVKSPQTQSQSQSTPNTPRTVLSRVDRFLDSRPADNSDQGESKRDSTAASTPPNYNREYYRPPILKNVNDETDTNERDMQQLPISDALRMLLRPYLNRSGTIDEHAAMLAESHIMNLAATASNPTKSTTTTSTSIRPPTQTGDNEDDVELIFTDEQHSLVTVPSKNATHNTKSELYPSSQSNPQDPYESSRQKKFQGSERNKNWHSQDYHQRHPHLSNPFSLDERLSSIPSPHNTKWPKPHHAHSRNFHQRHPNLPNPFETTTPMTNAQGTNIPKGESAASAVSSQIDLRFTDVDQECKFDCENGNCVKESEICDGVNNCGNRQDEAKCDHLGYEIRLTGGDSTNMGRIEVKILGKWGYICDDKFGLLDADVACKELGFKLGASEVRGNSFYPPTETNFSFIMDEVECIGNETMLRECSFKGWGVNNCGPDEVVGVVCKVPLLKCPNNYWLCSTSKECIPPAFVCDNTPDCADKSDESERVCNSPVEYRLEGGRSATEGRVEVMYHGEWGSVCDDDFGQNEAQVLCNSLGYYGPSKIEKNIFGPGSGPIWLDQVSCFGNETAIDKCNHWAWGEHNCNHTEDVGLRCTAGPAPRRTTTRTGIEGVRERAERQRSMENSSTTLEDIGLYATQFQRSSKFMNINDNEKRCGHFKQNILDEYEHPEERVVNGTVAKRGQHPWQATIRTKGRGGISSHWCGAVLISKKHLLTAAHCLVGYPKGAYFIRLGDHYANIAESSEIDSYIENWYIHEKFRDKTHMNNDIALIVLKNPVRFNDYVQPICLPEKGAPLQVNRFCTISGWGSIKSGESTPSNILRAAQLPILSDATCKQAHVYGTSMTEGMFCAGSMDESVDACDGDSGGPLVCSDEDGETLHGIISWGQQCGFANKPGVYVRVEKYIDWIYEKINFSMQQTAN